MFGSDLSSKVCKMLLGWFLFGSLFTSVRNHYTELIFIKFNIGWYMTFNWPSSVFCPSLKVSRCRLHRIFVFLIWVGMILTTGLIILRSSHKYITVLLQLGCFANEAQFCNHIFQHSFKILVFLWHIFLCGTHNVIYVYHIVRTFCQLDDKLKEQALTNMPLWKCKPQALNK
jgi:hypothetical protein